MPEKHLHYIGTGTLYDHPITLRVPDNDPNEHNTNPKDFTQQKADFLTCYNNTVAEYSSDQKEKEDFLKGVVITQEELEKFEQPYILIKTYGKVPVFLLTQLKSDFSSIEIKCLENFNRHLIFSLSKEDFQKFVNIMKEIGEYNPTRPVFHPSYNIYKVVERYKYYSIDDRTKTILGEEINGFVVKLFQVSSQRKSEIISNLSKDFGVSSLAPSILVLEPQGDKPLDYFIGKTAGLIDDIQKMYNEGATAEFINSGEEGQNINFNVSSLNTENLPLVGVIDTGVKGSLPIRQNGSATLVDEEKSDCYLGTTNPLLDSQNHGTGVASLVVFGKQLGTPLIPLEPSAKIASLKITSSDTVNLKPQDLIEIIQYGYNEGIRIFNLSIDITTAMLDNGTHSVYTYVIDYLLAQEGFNDVLFFISSGNIDEDELNDLKTKYHNTNSYKFDELTNIFWLADSTNSISVGSIGDDGLASEFSRKNHLDFGAPLTVKKQTGTIGKITTTINCNAKHNHKPDFVEKGEDVSLASSRYGETLYKNSGSSFSAPLVCNIACKIKNLYPHLKSNSIKALLLNSSSVKNVRVDLSGCDPRFLPEKIKRRNKLYRGSKIGSDSYLLPQETDSITKRYLGFGKISEERCLYSGPQKATIIFEDRIRLNHEICYEIKLPQGQGSIFHGDGRIKLIGSLSFNHIPIISDHLNYNPIHLSYRILSCEGDEYSNIVNRIKELKKDERVNNISHEDDIARLEDQKEKFVIQKWSEDNYYPKHYSNMQSCGNDNYYRKNTISKKTNGNLYVEVRCNIKNKSTDTLFFKEIQKFFLATKGIQIDTFDDLHRYHNQNFSLVLTIELLDELAIDLRQILLTNNIASITVSEDSLGFTEENTVDDLGSPN